VWRAFRRPPHGRSNIADRFGRAHEIHLTLPRTRTLYSNTPAARDRNGRLFRGSVMLMQRRYLFLLLPASLLLTLVAVTGEAGEGRLAIRGYDPVAYFTDGKPVPGVSDFELKWHDAR